MLHKKALVTLLALVVLLALADPASAACKVKGNSTANKIQAAPTKRMTNKLLFDVVAKKTNATTTDEDEEDE